MGCDVSRPGPTIIVVQPPDEPVHIRLRLLGSSLVPDIREVIKARLCEFTDEFGNRFDVAGTDKVDMYMVRVLPMEGDTMGTTRSVSHRVIGRAIGSGIPLGDNCKIIGAKEIKEHREN